MKRFIMALVALVLPIGALTVMAPSSAQADTASSTSKTAPGPTQAANKTSTTIKDCSEATSTDSCILILGQSKQVDSVKWRGTLVEGWSIHFTKAEKRRLMRPSNCIWADGKNYYSTIDTSHGWHPDTNMHLCRSSKSPTGWVKVGGGQSGIPCMNVASPNSVPPLPHVPEIKGPITETRSFEAFFGHERAASRIHLNVHQVCGQSIIDFETWVKGFAKAHMVQKIALKVKGHFTKFEAKLKAYLASRVKSSSKVRLMIQCTSQPSTPSYSCDRLHVTPGQEDRSVTVDTFSTSQSNGATFKNAVIDWGDGTSSAPTASPVGLTHSYGADGTYTIKATAHFDVNGTDATATGPNCQQAVTFTTKQPEKPTLSATTINDVERSWVDQATGDTHWSFMRNFTATFNVPGSDPGTLMVDSAHGKFVVDDGSNQPCKANGVRQFSVQGNSQLVLTYCAGTEGDQDTVTVTLRDNTTGQSATPVTQTFNTPPPSTHP